MFGDPYGNRTHDSALRGPRLNRLTNGPSPNDEISITLVSKLGKSFLLKKVLIFFIYDGKMLQYVKSTYNPHTIIAQLSSAFYEVIEAMICCRG